MAITTINQSISAVKKNDSAVTSPFARFLNWAASKEEERIFWTGIGLGLHGCVITPLAFLVVVMSGINFFLLALVMMSIVSVLIVNLAALPTRVTVPAFFISLIVDIAVVAACAVAGFNIH